jgi:hypothetical protein
VTSNNIQPLSSCPTAVPFCPQIKHSAVRYGTVRCSAVQLGWSGHNFATVYFDSNFSKRYLVFSCQRKVAYQWCHNTLSFYLPSCIDQKKKSGAHRTIHELRGRRIADLWTKDRSVDNGQPFLREQSSTKHAIVLHSFGPFGPPPQPLSMWRRPPALALALALAGALAGAAAAGTAGVRGTPPATTPSKGLSAETLKRLLGAVLADSHCPVAHGNGFGRQSGKTRSNDVLVLFWASLVFHLGTLFVHFA